MKAAIALVRRLFNLGLRLKALIEAEIKSKARVRLKQRLTAWRHGFLSESLIIYQMDRENFTDFLSDYARRVKTPDINGVHKSILENKIIFGRFFRSDVIQTPRVFFWLNGSTMFSIYGDNSTTVDAMEILKLCRDEGRLIIKPVGGGGGGDVFLLETEDENQIIINLVKTSFTDFEKFLKSQTNSIVTEFVEQHSYAENVFPLTSNTVRMVTMWDYDAGRPFVATAVHRFGRTTSIPVDNWSRGGLSAAIELDLGRLGKGAVRPSHGQVEWYSAHPDTGQQIEGLKVPGWETVCDQILRASTLLPFVPYIGWDIVVTESGFTVLEGNNYSDVNLLQVHGPLLRQSRVKKFYEYHGVI
jgi:hypothetical protein